MTNSLNVADYLLNQDGSVIEVVSVLILAIIAAIGKLYGANVYNLINDGWVQITTGREYSDSKLITEMENLSMQLRELGDDLRFIRLSEDEYELFVDSGEYYKEQFYPRFNEIKRELRKRNIYVGELSKQETMVGTWIEVDLEYWERWFNSTTWVTPERLLHSEINSDYLIEKRNHFYDRVDRIPSALDGLAEMIEETAKKIN
ncbi:hypothetical protein ACFQJC_07375 [Haloferax namakaokahaiae]|uniref:Uncharacterized protein n=1 Tax=Haloferax namakaokahaiae TaxID=1748331 RepID=A0ABD5ZDF9_9EURY